MKAVALTILLFTGTYSFAQVAEDSVARPRAVQALPQDAIRIFPNPAVSNVYITVKLDGLAIKTVFLYDKDGNRVIEQKINSSLSVPVKLNISNLQAGKYYAVIETNKQPFRSVLMKQ